MMKHKWEHMWDDTHVGFHSTNKNAVTFIEISGSTLTNHIGSFKLRIITWLKWSNLWVQFLFLFYKHGKEGICRVASELWEFKPLFWTVEGKACSEVPHNYQKYDVGSDRPFLQSCITQFIITNWGSITLKIF